MDPSPFTIDVDVPRAGGRPPNKLRTLAPSLTFELHLRWIDRDDLLELYEATLALLGDRFAFHARHDRAATTRFRDRAKAFAAFEELLTRNRGGYLWFKLADIGGRGTTKALGGVGSATFDAWLRPARYSHEAAAAQVAQYKALLAQLDTPMLFQGANVSRVRIHFPLDIFDSFEALRDWILARRVVAEGRFFSGCAGYGLQLDRAYSHRPTQARLAEILRDYPGFDFDLPVANSMGRVLDPSGEDLLPIVRRLNWLTLVATEGLALLGPPPADAPWSRHELARGACFQIGEAPVTAADHPALDAWRALGRHLAPLDYRLHERQTFSVVADAQAKAWLTYFQARGA